jgi:RNA polymerase sigma factor (sigma-70 family)
MTNEELAIKIKNGEYALMANLWEQLKQYAIKRMTGLYYRHYKRCISLGVALDDLEQEAFLGIHAAVYKYEVEHGAKFLTYADYHIKNQFYVAAKLRKDKMSSHTETSLEDTIAKSKDGKDVKLEDYLIDTSAEDEIYGFIELDYQGELRKAINKTLRCLLENQRDTAFACFGRGLSYSEYAQQKGVSRQSVHESGKRTLAKLRANSGDLASFLVKTW